MLEADLQAVPRVRRLGKSGVILSTATLIRMLAVTGVVISAAFLFAAVITFKRTKGSTTRWAIFARTFVGSTVGFALGILIFSIQDLFT